MKRFFVLLGILCTTINSVAMENNEAPVEFQKVAKEWAKDNFQGKIDKGTPYFTANNQKDSWAFIVYKKEKPFQTKNDLRKLIKDDYYLYEQACVELNLSMQNNDKDNI